MKELSNGACETGISGTMRPSSEGDCSFPDRFGVTGSTDQYQPESGLE